MNGETNLNDKSEKGKTCAKNVENGPKVCEIVSASFYAGNKYLCSKTVCTPKPLPFVDLTFPKIEKLCSNFAYFQSNEEIHLEK